MFCHTNLSVLAGFAVWSRVTTGKLESKNDPGGVAIMARYSKKAGKKVEKAMHERKHGTLKSGKSGKKVTSKKQAIAIGLSEARAEGAKVPKKSSKKSSKKGSKKRSTKKRSSKKK
jgi:hypothetical protein